jgi:hypothetical protein
VPSPLNASIVLACSVACSRVGVMLHGGRERRESWLSPEEREGVRTGQQSQTMGDRFAKYRCVAILFEICHDTQASV